MNVNDLPDILIEFLSKSTIALAFGFLLIVLLRKLSPSWKHGMWLRVFLASLAIPLLLLLPRWEVIPRLQQEEIPVVESVSVVSPVTGADEGIVISGDARVAPEKRFRISLPWAFFAVWAAGALVLVLRSLIAGVYLRRIARHSRSACPEITARFQEIYRTTGLKRPVSLIVASSVASPFTWGFSRPRIVLPESVESWSDSDLDMILLHELEHVKRRDALAVLISRVFLVLNWINPFAWLAIRQTVRFREEACDTRVLRAGHTSETYAEMLFRQARTASAPFLQTCATAVAETGTIEKRIQMILSPHFQSSSHPTVPIFARGVAVLLVSSILFVGMAGREATATEAATEVSEDSDVAIDSDEVRRVVEMKEKMDRIIIPSIEFKDTPVQDALRFLQQKSVELDDSTKDSGEKGINIVVQSEDGKANDDARITLRLIKVPLTEALRYTTALAQLKFKVEPHAVVVSVLSTPLPSLITNVYQVPPRFLMPKAGDGSVSSEVKTAKQVLEDAGVVFREGSAAIYNSSTSQLIVRNSQDQMDIVEAYIESLGFEKTDEMLTKVKEGWEKPLKEGEEKLKTIVLPKIEFADTPFADAISFLQQRSVELDPDKKGFNFILQGTPVVGDLKGIKITLKLSNVPFAEGLRYTCRLAGCEYVVEPNAIVIRPAQE